MEEIINTLPSMEYYDDTEDNLRDEEDEEEKESQEGFSDNKINKIINEIDLKIAKVDVVNHKNSN